jgi:hypothetical protein
VCTGCFHTPEAAITHLSDLRSAANERGFRGRIHFLSSVVRERRHLEHRPTAAQVRDLARWNGREPGSYLLDPVNVEPPEPAFALERQHGRYALVFTASDRGRRRELVALPDGGGFDLLSALE